MPSTRFKKLRGLQVIKELLSELDESIDTQGEDYYMHEAIVVLMAKIDKKIEGAISNGRATYYQRTKNK